MAKKSRHLPVDIYCCPSAFRQVWSPKVFALCPPSHQSNLLASTGFCPLLSTQVPWCTRTKTHLCMSFSQCVHFNADHDFQHHCCVWLFGQQNHCCWNSPASHKMAAFQGKPPNYSINPGSCSGSQGIHYFLINFFLLTPTLCFRSHNNPMASTVESIFSTLPGHFFLMLSPSQDTFK